MGVRCRLVRAEWALRAGTERVSLDRWLAEWTAAAAEGGRVVAAWPFSPFVSSTAAVVVAAAEALSSFWCSLSTPALVTGWVDAAAAAAARVCSCCTSSCASVTTKTHTYG